MSNSKIILRALLAGLLSAGMLAYAVPQAHPQPSAVFRFPQPVIFDGGTTNGVQGSTFAIQANGPTTFTSSFAAAMQTPPLPTLTPFTTGGTLATGTYYVVMTATDANGGESLPSPEASVAITGPTGRFNASTLIPGTGSMAVGASIITYRAYVGTTSGGENTYFVTSPNGGNNANVTSLSGTAGIPPTSNTALLNKVSPGGSWLALEGPGSGIDAPALYLQTIKTDVAPLVGGGTTAQFDVIANPAAASTANYVALGIFSSVSGAVATPLTGAAVYGLSMNISNGSSTTLGATFGIGMNIGSNGASNLTTATGLQINRYANDPGITTNVYGIHILDLSPASSPAGTLSYGILFDSSARFGLPYFPIRFANGQGPVFRNAAGTADIQAPFINADNNLNVGIGSGAIIPNGDGTVSLGLATNRMSQLFIFRCASAASPAVCGNAPSGSVAIAAAATSVTVNAGIAVSANSQILVTEDSSLGTLLAVTCNATTGRTYTISARTAGISFTITASAAPVTNPACLSYWIVN